MYKVLLVDSDETTLNDLKEILNKTSNNVEVITATQGQHAISILQSNQIDIVTTNVQLPDLDVLEFLIYINNNFTNTISTIITENTTQETAENLDKIEFIRILYKPLDPEQVKQTYSELLDENFNKGSVSLFSLGVMLQLIEINERSCLIGVKSSQTNNSGKIYFKDGVPHASLFGQKKGEEAVYDMMGLSDIHLELRKPPTKKIKKNIQKSCSSLLLESRRLHKSDEKESLYTEMSSQETVENFNNVDDVLTEADFFTSQSAEVESTDSSSPIKGEEQIQEINEILENFKRIEGLEAVAVLTPDGEVAAQLNPGNLSLQEMGALANDVLLKSQKGSEAMNLGRGSMVHIDAPKGEIICRCLNEGTDFAATSSGRAHIHLIVVLDKEGGLAMAKMKAENAIKDLAPLFR